MPVKELTVPLKYVRVKRGKLFC